MGDTNGFVSPFVQWHWRSLKESETQTAEALFHSCCSGNVTTSDVMSPSWLLSVMSCCRRRRTSHRRPLQGENERSKSADDKLKQLVVPRLKAVSHFRGQTIHLFSSPKSEGVMGWTQSPSLQPRRCIKGLSKPTMDPVHRGPQADFMQTFRVHLECSLHHFTDIITHNSVQYGCCVVVFQLLTKKPK